MGLFNNRALREALEQRHSAEVRAIEAERRAEKAERSLRLLSAKHCSFCGKSQDDVRKLIAGPAVFICDGCVDLCADILQEEGVRE